MVNWYEDLNKDYGAGKLSEIKAELDVVVESGEIDWERDFVVARVYDVAYDAVDVESSRYGGSKSIAASYMLINGLCDERFKELYKKTYRMHDLSKVATLVIEHLNNRGVELGVSRVDYRLPGVPVRKGSSLRIFRKLYIFTEELANQMLIDTSYLISVLILSGSTKDVYREMFEEIMEKMSTAQIVNYKVMQALAASFAEIGGKSSVKELMSRVCKVDSETVWWGIKGVKRGVRELAKKVAKMEGKRVAEVVEEAVVGWYAWVLAISEGE